MKLKPLFLTTCFTVAIAFCANATLINPSNNSFEGATASFSFPVTGTVNDSYGSWNFQLSAVAALSGGVQIGTATALGGGYVPAPQNGTNEVAIKFPVGVVVDANLSQTLPVAWLPNSTYTLNVYVASSTTAGVLSGSTLALKSTGGTQASQSVLSVANLLTVSNIYQPVTLTYKTGNTAPTGNVGVSLDFPNVLQVAGSVYVDNVTLTVVPNNVQVATTTGSNGSGGRTMNFSATGGAP
ncbi:MAG TPA: hypothetical protein VG347_00215 [Verrucomicrobiae bacterium]|nr:hypothetical protein [Verrucomicrobiae bacterium]